MASVISLSFLRPRALPRASTITYILHASRQYEYNSSPNKPARIPTPRPSVPRQRATSRKGIIDPPPQAAIVPTQANKLYNIQRTAGTNLPIYHLSKAGGNQKLTRLKGIEGDLTVLRDELRESLGLEDKEVTINQLTRQIMVKVRE